MPKSKTPWKDVDQEAPANGQQVLVVVETTNYYGKPRTFYPDAAYYREFKKDGEKHFCFTLGPRETDQDMLDPWGGEYSECRFYWLEFEPFRKPKVTLKQLALEGVE